MSDLNLYVALRYQDISIKNLILKFIVSPAAPPNPAAARHQQDGWQKIPQHTSSRSQVKVGLAEARLLNNQIMISRNQAIFGYRLLNTFNFKKREERQKGINYHELKQVFRLCFGVLLFWQQL